MITRQASWSLRRTLASVSSAMGAERMEAEARGFLRLKAERGDRRRAQLNAGGRFVLIGSDEAIEKAQQQQGAFDRRQ